MLWWVVDNANVIVLVLLLAAVALGVHFWLTRRVAALAGLGGVAALIVLVWVLSLLVTTDRKRLVRTVEDVAARINKQDLQGAFAHFADSVQITIDGKSKQLERDLLAALAGNLFKKGRIEGLVVWDVEVEKVDRPRAIVSFYVRPTNEQAYARCEAQCVLQGDTNWRVAVLKIDMPPGGRQWIGWW